MITSPLNRGNFMDSDSFNIKELFYPSENIKNIYILLLNIIAFQVYLRFIYGLKL